VATFKVNTSLYCTAHTANDELQRVLNRLIVRDWEIVSSSVDTSSGGFYILAVDNPLTLTISKPSARQEDAEADIDTALHETGNFSLAGEIATTVNKVVDSTAGALDGLANADPKDLGKGIGLGLGTVLVATVALIVGYMYVRKRL
jgi:hypothetical protein